MQFCVMTFQVWQPVARVDNQRLAFTEAQLRVVLKKKSVVVDRRDQCAGSFGIVITNSSCGNAYSC